ncbi:23S rRNA (adenine(2503)-C(2))-methyltransferase RlmN [Lacrimispora sp. NSJ-141]|uniref:Probable dual-specificity RNA methyltransferase RlmN n=1 Tax=Lientehia hominis TaxID=2897778 RepID=A0AAP2RI10_9FIRM|nr:23S rRNA (adenine(2503)-C(2))-methyltransferase RlmN [Lientehia hominis]MCD2492367.1 23S rRNA (adenine(2503)-C(2))-methyltransferase RlmN [Lientehia hominis]
MKTDIKSLTLEELKDALADMGEKPFRAGQIFSWLHEKLAASFDEMTNLSLSLRQRLSERFFLTLLEPVEVLVSELDRTRKYLFRLDDGNVIESVWMEYHHGNSVCISSQVGCRMGCRFCASTLDGLVRDLRPSEMLEQIYRMQTLMGKRVSNVVVMGSGEPLDNYDNFVKFIRLLTDEHGFHLSARNITVSTCGLPDRICRLAEEKLPITLALSLHAADDGKRRELMPIASRYSLKEVLPACDAYFEKTGRRPSFEYSLVGGVNDTKEEAEALAALLGHRNCHVNLIPVNPIKERKYVRSGQEAIRNFKNILEKSGINVTIRREMGRDINGACGQLRRSYREDRP